MPDRVLLVEDRSNLRELLERVLAETCDVVAVADGDAALACLATDTFDVVVTDVRLPRGDGNAVLAAARAKEPPSEVILMTAYAEVPAAVQALKAGAYDYLQKPFEPKELARVVARAAERHALLGRARDLEAALDAKESGLVGRSAAIVQVRKLLERLGPLPVPVLLTGESGTGKEVAARELHRLWGKGSFVVVRCGAIPENLIESELFGVGRGADSGAVADRAGAFEAASGGTLFLAEIGELSPSLQVKLNRALEEGEVRRVGENAPRNVAPRVVAATHRDLQKLVAEGTFRSDFYSRLKVFHVAMPPLRDRREDLPLLCARFLQLAAARYGSRARRLDATALQALEEWPWPGNVRELRHAIEYAAVLADGETIEVEHLPEALRTKAQTRSPAGSYREALERAQDHAGREYLLSLLHRAGGNVTRAAQEAGVERESLHRLLRKHEIDPSRFRGPT